MTVSDTATSDTPRSPRGDALVVLENVDKHFGDLHVLKDINISIGRGEVVVVIGPSGSGESTLCRTINRLETIDSHPARTTARSQPLHRAGGRGRRGVLPVG